MEEWKVDKRKQVDGKIESLEKIKRKKEKE